jgi:cytochrome c oxidase subunit 2
MKSVFYVHSQADYDTWVKDNTLAQQSEDASETVAVSRQNPWSGEFLRPYTEEMGINADTLAQIHSLHSH